MAKIKAKQIDQTGLVSTAFTPTSVPAGTSMEVPAGFQWVVSVEELVVDNELTLNGDLVLL